MELTFNGKRALVTGAGKGLGHDIAIKLANSGAKVVALSRTQEDLDSLKSEVPSIETKLLDISADWSTTKKDIESLGHFDLLVNSAGVARIVPFLDVTEGDMDFVMDTNYKALFNVSQVVARSMVDKKTGGAIVHLSSIASKMALKDHAVYCSSKRAVDALTSVMALELGPHNIRTNTVCPTVVMTPMGRDAWSDPAKAKPMLDRTPMHRFAEIEDVTHAVLFLLSDQAGYLNGVTLPVDGGLLAA